MPLDRETGRKRGFAFVDLGNAEEEKKAIDDLQDVEWMGRAISVRVAEPRRWSAQTKELRMGSRLWNLF